MKVGQATGRTWEGPWAGAEVVDQLGPCKVGQLFHTR